MKSQSEEEFKSGDFTPKSSIGQEDLQSIKSSLSKVIGNMSSDEKVDRELQSLRVLMEDYNPNRTNKLMTVGDFLSAFLKVAGVSSKKFASYTGINHSELNLLLIGKKSLTPEEAYVLGQIFKISPVTWAQIDIKNKLHRFKSSNDKNMKQLSFSELVGR